MFLAEVVVSSGSTIPVAVIAAAGLVLSVTIPAWLQRRKTTNYLEEHVGKKNGQGTIVEMVEQVLNEMGEMRRDAETHNYKDDVRARAIFRHIDLEDPWPSHSSR